MNLWHSGPGLRRQLRLAAELKHLGKAFADAAQRELDRVADSHLVDTANDVRVLALADVVVVRLMFETVEAHVFEPVVGAADVQRRTVVVELDVRLRHTADVLVGLIEYDVREIARCHDELYRASVDWMALRFHHRYRHHAVEIAPAVG